ncbi:hypothetical protein BC835DRAFT_1302539 [Cytidiella melzeri]|nr:hypothetical protein BC835DRAFT_1302539 [Cytidiella melzeri]
MTEPAGLEGFSHGSRRKHPHPRTKERMATNGAILDAGLACRTDRAYTFHSIETAAHESNSQKERKAFRRQEHRHEAATGSDSLPGVDLLCHCSGRQALCLTSPKLRPEISLRCALLLLTGQVGSFYYQMNANNSRQLDNGALLAEVLGGSDGFIRSRYLQTTCCHSTKRNGFANEDVAPACPLLVVRTPRRGTYATRDLDSFRRG